MSFVVMPLNLLGKQNVKVLEEASLPAVAVSKETANKKTMTLDLNADSDDTVAVLYYCTISNCSAWLVTRDRRAEILLRQMPVGRVT